MKYYVSNELKGRIDMNSSQAPFDQSQSTCHVQNIDVCEGYVYLQYYCKSLLLKPRITFDCLTISDKVRHFLSPMEFKLKSIKKDDNKLLVTIFIEDELFWEKLDEKDHD